MNFFKNISNLDLSNDKKSDIVFVIVFSLIFVLMCIITWGRLGDPIVDCGREPYILKEILNGKLLIKDIFILYNPLAYQINAVFFKLFGAKLSVLFILGIISSYSILSIVYLIMRMLFKPYEAFAAVLVTMTIGVFNVSVSNYIFPYCYAMVYSFLGAIIAIFLGIKAIQKRNDKTFNSLILLAFLSLGFSIANKFDYIFIAIPLIAIPLLLKKFKLKEYFYCLAILSVFLVLSYGILFLQGFSLENLSDYISFGKRFFHSDATIYFYKFFFLFSPIKYISTCIRGFLIFSLITVVNYILIKNILKFSSKIVKGLSFPLIVFLNFKILYAFNGEISYIFSWIVLFILLFLFLYIFSNLKNKEFWNENINLMSIFVLFCTVLSTVKTFFLTEICGSSSYIISLIIISLLIILLKFFPVLFQIKDTKCWSQILSIFFIVLSFSFAILNLKKIYHNQTVFNYGNEKIYMSKSNAYIIGKSVEYLKKNTPLNATCLVMPEGVIINFLSNRKTMDKYYHLLPNHIEALGEDNIVKDLKLTPPEYILINDRNTGDFGLKYICDDYAKKICKFVDSNYTQEKYFSLHSREYRWYDKNLTSMAIYKLKSAK